MNSVQPDRPEWLIEHRQEIATLANKVGVQLTGCGVNALRDLVDQNDVAYAVWNDAEVRISRIVGGDFTPWWAAISRDHGQCAA